MLSYSTTAFVQSTVLPHELKSPTLASESCKILVRDGIVLYFFNNTPVTDAKGLEILTLSSQHEEWDESQRPLDGRIVG